MYTSVPVKCVPIGLVLSSPVRARTTVHLCQIQIIYYNHYVFVNQTKKVDFWMGYKD